MPPRDFHAYAHERALERDRQREPGYSRARPLPRRNYAGRVRLLDLMCGAIESDDEGVLQPPVKLAGAL